MEKSTLWKQESRRLRAGGITVVGCALLFFAARKPLSERIPSLVLSDVAVFDGTGAPPRHHLDVEITGERITAIRPHDAREYSAQSRVLDLTGRFLVPGFIDMHEHVAAERWTMTPLGVKSATFDSSLAMRTLDVLMASGITTVRNPGSWVATTAQEVALRQRAATDVTRWPRIVTAGAILSDPSLSVDAVRAEVRAQARRQVDFIKVYSGMPPLLVQAAIDEAHRNGVRAAGHLQRTTWTQGAGFGIDFIEHGAPWSADVLPQSRRSEYASLTGMRARITWLEELDLGAAVIDTMIRALASHHVIVTPTLVALQSKFWGYDASYHGDSTAGYLPEFVDDWRIIGTNTDDWSTEEFARIRAAWPKLLALTKRLHDGGVILTAGADLGSPWVTPGSSFHQELKLLVDAGISPGDVIRIATQNGARALGIANDVGTIEVGKRADLVVLGDDPGRDIAATRNVERVIRSGRVFRPEELLPPLKERVREGDLRTSDGARLHFYVTGTGRDTIVVPLGVVLEPELRSLAQDRTVIFYDPRGRGLSDSLDSRAPRARAFALDLDDLDAVRRHFRIGRVTLVGWSFYALLAARYAIEHPEHTARVVLVSPLAPRRTPFSDLMGERYAARLSADARRALDSSRRARVTTADSIEYCRQNDAVYGPANMNDRGRNLVLHTDRCWLRNEWPEESARASGRSLQSLGDYDWRNELRTLSVPMLVMHGADDSAPVEGSREWLIAPRATLEVIPRAAHWPFLEQSRLFRTAIESFLRKE